MHNIIVFTWFTAAAEGAALALFSYDNLKASKKLQVDLQLHEHIKESDLRRYYSIFKTCRHYDSVWYLYVAYKDSLTLIFYGLFPLLVRTFMVNQNSPLASFPKNNMIHLQHMLNS